ncbi:ComF family protein [Alloscardovia omnicolens]|uniref:ComF family protein n=1 Tax=Alloscardovia omnicolens TaxID=419015 RepID=UPI003A7A410F
MYSLARRVSKTLNTYAKIQGDKWSTHVCSALTMKAHVHKAVTASARGQRMHRLDEGLRLTANHSMNNASVIVLDDIVTTGSTMRACVRFLRAQGANIYAVCCLADVRDNDGEEHTF